MRQLVPERVVTSENGVKVFYPSIWETTDINELRLLNSNRPLIPSHVQKMYNSVVEMGVLRDVVVVRCNFINYIGDGQHITEVFKLLTGVPIRFKLIEVDTEEEVYKIITKLNTTQRRFSFKNFINGWVEFRPDYRILIEYSEKYNIVDTVLSSILTGLPINTAKDQIKSGNFKVLDINKVTTILNTIYKYSSLTNFKMERYGSEGLYQFIIGIGLDKYLLHEDDFIMNSMEYIEQRQISDTTFGDTKTYLKFFNEMWNF